MLSVVRFSKDLTTDLRPMSKKSELSPHIPRMREALAGALGLDREHVSVKAKTSEGLSADSASAHAVVLLASS
jgi:2C-methyl-D-erythritol 2,4-cyclodiphosphate synthase